MRSQPVNPSIRRKRLQPNPHSPAATTRAAFASLPSAVMRPKFLTQSHTISRNLSSNAPASLQAVYISKNRTKRQLLRLPAARIHCDSRCPCTKTAICAGAAAVNHPHHTNCVNHSSNKCQPALVRALLPSTTPSTPTADASSAPIRNIFFREQKNTRIHAAIAPLRANLILTSRTDRITEQGIT